MSRETNTTVRILDKDRMEALVREQVKNVYGVTDEDTLARIWCEPQALIVSNPTNTRERYAVIVTEGVGQESGEHNGLVECWAGMGMMTDAYSVRFHYSVLEELAGESTPLADFVRVFGSRLETNFHIWSRWANRTPGAS
mgnify:CR=1 FL=1